MDVGPYRKDSIEVADRYFASLKPRWDVPYKNDAREVAGEADRAGLDLALVFAVEEAETMGRETFGADWGTIGADRVPFAWLPVTKARVDALVRHVRAGGVSNGVGKFQATYGPLLLAADAMPGGASVSRNTTRKCLELLRDNIKAYGYEKGLAAYNAGPSNPNYTYARNVAALHGAWKKRLAR